VFRFGRFGKCVLLVLTVSGARDAPLECSGHVVPANHEVPLPLPTQHAAPPGNPGREPQ